VGLLSLACAKSRTGQPLLTNFLVFPAVGPRASLVRVVPGWHAAAVTGIVGEWTSVAALRSDIVVTWLRSR
jgi:hypothetical protein